MKSDNASGFKAVYLSQHYLKTYEYRFQFRGEKYRKGGFKTALSASRAYVKLHKNLIEKAFPKKK